MLICPKCNQQQDSGKFCGVCGEQVITIADGQDHSTQQQEVRTASEQAAVTTASEITSSKFKEGVSHYWSYFLNLLKNPTQAFALTEKHFTNSLITLALFALIYSLSIYFLANSLVRSFGGYFVQSVPFFELTTRLIFGVIIMLAITFGSSFVMIKIAKNQESFQTVIAQYGSILVPFTGLNLVAMLGGLMGSIELTLFPLALSFILVFIFIPVLFVYEKASNINIKGQKVYLSLATIVLISLILYILGDVVFSNIINDLEENLYPVF
ncbi:DUF6574 domain-containing protein [Oceanobacillus manasiensis]|uniref:DUF6574 domain-containing protein n=1 Tax=Oceanobacillus manasiensis TaxID=586413 RepID=UPI0005AB3A8E|nr:DUF6574 domain-containing protein [Oceanobacillus manasiensis]